MADITLNSQQTYTFSRYNPYGSSVYTMIVDGTDRAHKAKTFNNRVTINTSNSGVVSGLLQVITTGTTSGNTITISNGTTSAGNGIVFVGQNQWIIGSYNDTSNEDDFQITDNSVLVSSGARTNVTVGMCISKSREIFFPNLDAAAGTFPVEYNTTTREITYDSSTLRSKKNITTAPSLLFDKVLELQPREFERKNPKSDNITSVGKFIGLIAEEAADVHPQFAKYAPDYMLDENGKRAQETSSDALVPGNIDWPAVTTALIGKVKQLEQRIQQLES